VPNACKSHAPGLPGEWRTAEEHVGTCPSVGDNAPKGALIPHTLPHSRAESRKARTEGPAAHQVVGVVTAHQAGDG
jgi:hypothetical protein